MSIKLLNVVESYKGLSHQKQAIEALERLLGASGLADDTEWVKLWRTPTTSPSTVAVIPRHGPRPTR